MCWEDVRIDRKLLNIDDSSKIMMITSAGCNALSYLLDNPFLIHTVDINPKQTALLELKTQLIKRRNHADFYDFFWKGKSHSSIEIYQEIKEQLSIESILFWNENLQYFSPFNKGLLFHGGSGKFALILNRIIDRKNLRDQISEIAVQKDSTTKIVLFNEIKEALWDGFEKYVWSTNSILSLAGIPKTQRNAIGDMNVFMKRVLEQILVHQDVSENPYWGRYLGLDIEPLVDDLHHEQNFDRLCSNVDRIQFETNSINAILTSSKENYTHFVLLDHMDWLVENNQFKITELWRLIVNRSEKGAKILFRTAFDTLHFLPPFFKKEFELLHIEKSLLMHDRVGTYPNTYLAVKK